MRTDPEARENEVQFGPYRLAGPQGPLWEHHATVAQAPKELGVLWQLVTHAGHVVSKAALFSAVWGETIVSDGALTVCVRRLRAALGEDAAQPRYIATVHRVGYRFIGQVVSHQDAAERREETNQAATIDLFSPASHTQPPESTVVGREAELTQLHSLFAKVLKGERQLVFVTGEAGIGKSALVEVFLHRLASQHVRSLKGKAQRQNTQMLDTRPQTLHTGPWVAGGQCIEHYGAGEAYLPMLEILGRLCRQPAGAHIVNVLRRMAPTWLLQLLAWLDQADYAALQPRVAGATRERMLREMVEALESLSAERPVVLLLEDMHWSDVSTIDLLSMLARRREAARILVLATSRLAKLVLVNHPLKTLKQELVARGQAAEILLGGVQVAAVRQYAGQRLAGQGVESELTALVYRRTAGHPLFMVQLTDYLTQCAEREALTTAAAQALAAAIPQRLMVGSPKGLIRKA